MRKTLLILLIGIAFVGCSRDYEVTDSDIVAKAKEEAGQPKIDIITEIRHAYIKKIITYDSELYISVDYADYLTGEDAMEAEKRDEAYFLDGDETLTYVLDNYYISNINDKLRTLKLKENIFIELIRTDDDVYELEEKKIGNESQIRTYMDEEYLIVLHIDGGIVTGIEEQFFP